MRRTGFLLFFLISVIVLGSGELPVQAAKCPGIQNEMVNAEEYTVSGNVKKYRMVLSPYMDPVITLNNSAMEQVKIPGEIEVLLYEKNEMDGQDSAQPALHASLPVVWSEESFQKGLAGGRDFILEGEFVLTDGQKAGIENWEEVKPQLAIRMTTAANARRLKVKWNQKNLIISYDKPWGAGQLWLEYSNDLVNWTSRNVTDSMKNDYYDVGTCMLYVPLDQVYYVRLKIMDFVYEGYTDIWKAEYATGICSKYQPSESVNPPDTDETTGNNTSNGSGSGTETETDPKETELADGGSGGDRGGGGTKEPDRRPNTPSGGGSLSSGSGNKQKPDKGNNGSGDSGQEDKNESQGKADQEVWNGSGGKADQEVGNGNGSESKADQEDLNGNSGKTDQGVTADPAAQPFSGRQKGTGSIETDLTQGAVSTPEDGETLEEKSEDTGIQGESSTELSSEAKENAAEFIKSNNEDSTLEQTDGKSHRKAGGAAAFTEPKPVNEAGKSNKKIVAAVFFLLAGSGMVINHKVTKH